MILIDANVFLAYENKDDVHHTKACGLLNKIQGGTYGSWFITDYIFNEVVGVTLRKFGKERAVTIGEGLLKSVVLLNIDEHLLQEAWKIFTKTDLGLNLVDCTNLVALTVTNTDTIATFDEEFKKVSRVIS
ncbi:MAG: PIN domain-containing protein [Candidatus Woesearchaeota archaeon]|nr:PIN domain-containing protein [Candidatus Woesearchaeota archaeon]